MIQMTRKNTVVTGCYNSPKLSIINFETELSYLLPVSLNYVGIYPQVDEYILEESTEVEF